MALRLSKVGLAELSGLSRSTITKVEQGKPVDTLTLLKVLTVLKQEAARFGQQELVTELAENIRLLELRTKTGDEAPDHGERVMSPDMERHLSSIERFATSGKMMLAGETAVLEFCNRLVDFAEVTRKSISEKGARSKRP